MQTLTEKILKTMNTIIKNQKKIIKKIKTEKHKKLYTILDVEEIILDDNMNMVNHIKKIINDHNTEILHKAFKIHNQHCIDAQAHNKYINTINKFIKNGGNK